MYSVHWHIDPEQKIERRMDGRILMNGCHSMGMYVIIQVYAERYFMEAFVTPSPQKPPKTNGNKINK